MKLSNILKIGILVFLVTLGMIGISKYSLLNKKEELTEEFETVKKRDLIERVTVSGNVEPKRKTIIAAPFDGYIKKLYVKLGEVVKKDDPIVSVSQSLRSLDRVYPIRAPYKGVVVFVNKSEGEYVTSSTRSGSGIIRIDDIGSFYINSDISEIDYAKITFNQNAIIKISAITDNIFNGKVEEISLAPKVEEGWSSWRDSANVLYPVKVKVLNPNNKIKSGMSAIIDVITQKKEQALSIPHEYVFKKNNNYYVISENNKELKIKVGFQNEEFFEILEGLKEGDKVKKVDFMNIISG